MSDKNNMYLVSSTGWLGYPKVRKFLVTVPNQGLQASKSNQIESLKETIPKRDQFIYMDEQSSNTRRLYYYNDHLRSSVTSKMLSICDSDTGIALKNANQKNWLSAVTTSVQCCYDMKVW